MKSHIFYLLLALFCSMFVIAQEQVQEPLRSNHDAFLKFIGEPKLLTNQHYYLNALEIKGNQSYNSASSVYVNENQFSHYSELGSKQVHTLMSYVRENDSVVMYISHKTKQDEKIHTLQYKVIFSLSNQAGVQVQLDKEATDARIDWLKVAECVLKHAPVIYPQILKCFQEPNVANCILQLIEPISAIYQCIFNQTQLATVLPKGISEVSKNWSLNQSTTSQWIEYGSLNVIDRQVRITNYSSNILELSVGSELIGTGVVKIYLIKAKWMGTSGWSASGTVKLICQN